MGDSLSAAFGIPLESGWVQLLQARLRSFGYPHHVVNASVSGETTAGGLARLPAALERHHPKIVLIELGGNDGLRSLPLKQLRGNLAQMAALAKKAGAQPILFQMRIPSNYGPAYADGFFESFRLVARQHKAPLVPFFLTSLLDQPGMFQDDGIHPTVEAQARLLDAAWPTLEALLRESKPARAANIITTP